MATLKRGSTGPDVKQLQEQLQARGFSPGNIDGTFGGGTEAALIAFQKSEGLLADGVAGPKTLIKLEGGLKLHGNARRTDIVVFNPAGEKILLIECKAPSVNIDQKVFDQIARYNMVHKVALLAVSNGLKHYYCRIDFANKGYQFIEELPDYRGINS